jgi:hypothetical protein
MATNNNSSGNSYSPATYGVFSDWDITLKRWFNGTYKTQLKNVHIGKYHVYYFVKKVNTRS